MTVSAGDSLVSEAFEGPLTLLFTDVEGSTELRTSRGDEASHPILRAHEDLVRQQVARHGGREVKSLGDGLMVVFTSARRAVTCAADIQRAVEAYGLAHPDQKLRVRIGLNTGEVIAEGGDLYGEAINAAARIADKAKGGEILASSVVRELAGTVPGISFQDRGRFRLKGFPERRQLYEIVWESEATAAPPGWTRFVGREAERAELLGFLEKAIAGHGAVVVIGGEPGVGKTRMALEIATEGTRRGMLALIGHCYDAETAPPYIPFVEILEAAARGAARSSALRDALGDVAAEIARIVPELRRVFPDIPPPFELPPEQERRYLFNSIAEFMERAARRRPQLIVLDDLHWADEPTLLLLLHLAERVQELPILILATYRDVELDVARPLARTLEQLLRRRLAHRIALKRLAEENVAEMLTVLAGREPPRPLVHALYEETEGNPFFVEEVFKYLSEEGKLFDERGEWATHLDVASLEVPESIRLVVGRRLERLSEPARKVLGAAAVIGRGFSYELLEALGEVEPAEVLDAVDDAERARLITSTSDGAQERLTFAHELIRQTLLTALSGPRRRRLHLRVAETMESLYGDDLSEHAGDIAYHLEQAGSAADPKKTVRYLCMAGDRALGAAAFEDALRYFEDALSLLDEEDVGARAESLYHIGLCQRSLGTIDDALVTWRGALNLFEQVGDAERMGEVYFNIAQQLAWASKWPECLEMTARGLQSLPDDARFARAELLGLTGIIVANTGDFDTARSLIDDGYRLAQELDDAVLIGYGVLARSLILHAFVQLEESVETGMESVGLLRDAGRVWDYSSVLGFLQFALFFLGRWDEAVSVSRDLEPLATRIGHLGALVFARRARPLEAFLTGDLAALSRFVDEDLELSKQVGPLHLGQSYAWKGVQSFRRGDWVQAETDFKEAAEVEAPGFWRQLQWAYLMLFYCYQGRSEDALAILDGADISLPESGRPNHWGAWTTLFCAVEGLWLLGDKERCGSLYPLMLEALDTKLIGRVFDARSLHTLAGIAAAAAGEWEAAEGHFEDGLRQAETFGVVPDELETRRFYAAALIERRAAGDIERAKAMLEEARAGYQRLGWRKHVELCDELVARC